MVFIDLILVAKLTVLVFHADTCLAYGRVAAAVVVLLAVLVAMEEAATTVLVMAVIIDSHVAAVAGADPLLLLRV